MSNVWSWWIIIGTVVSLVACFWLVAWANSCLLYTSDAADERVRV